MMHIQSTTYEMEYNGEAFAVIFCRLLFLSLAQLKWFLSRKSIFIVFPIIVLNFGFISGQSYYAFGNGKMYDLEISYNNCSYSCSITEIGPNNSYNDGVTFCPNGNVYSMSTGIFQIDPLTGMTTLLMAAAPFFEMDGFACYQDSTFFSLDMSGNLYLINILSGTVTLIGNTGFIPVEELTVFNGEYYFPTLSGLVHLDVLNPGNSTLIISFPMYAYVLAGISASAICNTMFATNSLEDELVAINIADGSITPVCVLPDGVHEITTYNEFIAPSVCEVYLDLDCNNSSGAQDADFNSPGFDCISDPVPVADEDINILIDAAITEMTITLPDPLPDDPNEVLIMAGGIPGISATGSNTTMITLSNTGGAKMQDFKDALHLIYYNNTSALPTAGLRTVQVQFTTASMTASNIATAFIQVYELPLADVDLGPDQEICAGQSATLDAGNGDMYLWSTGETTQLITVDQPGQYMVTVSDGAHCPNQDTVEVFVLPVISVALTGDTTMCDNEQATITIQTDSPIAVTVTIEADPGSTFTFSGISGTYSFTDFPVETTVYTIATVVSDQPACIEITDPEQVIEVYPVYVFEQDVSICDGDSIWLGTFWESEAGVYENHLESAYGCDSIVTTYLTILPSVQIAQQASTCDPAAAGVTISYLDNPNGCDTVVTTTITLLPSDTTRINLSACSMAHTGTTFDTLSNQQGCDSLVITTTVYDPPADTTFLYFTTCDSAMIGTTHNITAGSDGCDSLVIASTSLAIPDTTSILTTSCDPAMVGIMHDTFPGSDGCDSLVITTTTFALADTTHLTATSCDPSQVGISQQILTGQDGCDSLVITTTTFTLADTTQLTATSCDLSQVGITQEIMTGQDGCDSVIITTTTLLPSDTVSIFSTTCDPSQTGIHVYLLANQYGCDSVVTETITLLPGDAIFLSSTTCISSEAGVFITALTNQHGCDSIITSTVTLIPVDTTIQHLFTCDPAQTGVVHQLLSGSDGCDSLVITEAALFELPQLDLQSVFDYNGFDISCLGESDGGVIASISGIPPYTYLWSTSHTEDQITGLSAGNYAVTITDGNGCTSDAVITLDQPAELTMAFEVTQPDCFDQALGVIRINATGGVPPYTYSKDGAAAQTSDEFDALADGIYQFTVIDANGCSAAEIISIDVPLMISVDLGSDQSISSGDTTTIDAIVNLPLEAISDIVWNGTDSSGCANCLHQVVAPIITTAYAITVISVDGCSDRDTMTVNVTEDRHIHIPNIFSPNGDGVNDLFRIYADDSVEEISALEIYDRWGNLVFSFTHKSPDDPAAQWDGMFHGERMNPGVFTYKAVIVFVNGERDVRYGDITLIR